MIIGDMEIRLRADIARLQRDMDDARRVVGGAVDGITRAATLARNALAGMAAGFSLGALAHQVIEAQREFDKLNASLTTATGSSANAAQAFKALQSFAATTPYSVKDATEAFIKMRNLGLDPSERALRSYGNTASAMSKGLDQMIEAVADAATGQFERLKEFGITAKQNGDQVSLTFKGMTSTIGNNAKEIQEYLRKLGEVDFAGGMELRAATLDGAISNLGDTWESVMRTIATNGIGQATMSAVMGLSGALQDLSAILDVVGGAATKEGKAVSEAGTLHKIVTAVFETIAVLGVNVAYVFEQIGTELGGLAAQAALVLQGDLKGAASVGDMMKKDAAAARKAVDEKSATILGAAQKAQDAQAAEAEQTKKTGADRLAKYAIELTAEQKQQKALADTLDIRNRLNGVNAQTASELTKLKTALDTGAISQAEYNKYTGKIKEDALKATTAYKDQVKALDLSADAIKRRGEAQAFANAQDREHLDFLRRTGQMGEEEFIGKSAAADVKALQDQKKALQEQLGLAGRKVDNPKEQQALTGQIDAVERQIGARRTKQERDLIELQLQRKQESDQLYASGIVGATAERDSLLAQVEAQFQYNQEIGLSTKQVAEVQAARMGSAAALKDEAAAALEAIDPGSKLAALYRAQAQAMRDMGDAKVRGAAKQEMFEKPIQDAAALVDIMSALDDAAQSAAQGMAKSFGSVGEAIGGMTTALTGYQRTEAAIAAQRLSSIKDAGGDQTKIQRANMMAAEASAQAQVKSYGDMASAAKGFFNENSAGYKVLGGIEKAYRATEMAMALEAMAKKIFFKETEVAANTTLNATKVAGEAASSAASTGLAATEASAWGITAVVKAIASMPFPLNLAAGAATLAAVVAIGAKMVGGLGGGSVSLSQQRQEAQGTGSVLGDSSAKSESIKRAIDLTAANSSTQINYLSGMLAALRSIQNGIASFASQVVQTSGITGDMAAGSKGGAAEFGSSTLGVLATGGIIGLALDKLTGGFVGKITGSILGSIFGGKTSVEDTGFTMKKASLEAIMNGGANALQYADIKKSGGWFGKDKTSVQETSLGADANAQFGLIIKSLGSAVSEAGKLLGVAGDDFTNKLNSFVVDIGKVSLKDLKGDELQKAIESVFSKLGDDMAQFAVGGLGQFQKVGEGYLETLVRVASDYAKLDASLTSVGMTFGATGLQSIAARESLIDLVGGIDEFQSKTASFADAFLTEAERLAPVQKYVSDELAKMNLGWVDTRDEFKQVVLGLDLTTDAGRSTYAALMGLSEAFAATHAAAVDATKSAQDIADERKDLLDQLDELTMTQTQLLAKQRDAVAEVNRPLWDNVQALKAQAAAAQAVKDAAVTLLSGVDSALSVLQSVVNREKQAVQSSIDAHTASVTKLQSLASSLHSTLDGMRSPEQLVTARADGQAQLRAAAAAARAGGALPDADSLKDALSAVQKDASDQFSSYTDYLRDLYTTQNDIGALAGITDDQLSVEQKALQAAKDQLDSLDAILTHAQEQIDVLKGQSTTLLSIDQAIGGLTAAILVAQKNPVVAATADITKAYQSALGRAPDAAGMEFWQGQAAAGTSTSNIVDAITGSAEAKNRAAIQKLYQDLLGRPADDGGLSFFSSSGASLAEVEAAMKRSDEYKAKVPGYANGGDFAGGARLVGEVGPEVEVTGASRIHSTQSLMDALRNPSSNNDALAAAVDRLSATVDRQRVTIEQQASALEQIQRNTRRQADTLDVVTEGGNAMRSKQVTT